MVAAFIHLTSLVMKATNRYGSRGGHYVMDYSGLSPFNPRPHNVLLRI